MNTYFPSPRGFLQSIVIIPNWYLIRNDLWKTQNPRDLKSSEKKNIFLKLLSIGFAMCLFMICNNTNFCCLFKIKYISLDVEETAFSKICSVVVHLLDSALAWIAIRLEIIGKIDNNLHCCNGSKTGRSCSNPGESDFHMSFSLYNIK